MGGARLKISFLDFGDYFRHIPEFYQATGTPVRIVELPTDASIEERAAVLNDFLRTEYKDTKVNIVAHSLGGLDARFAASVLHNQEILTITTIATPHFGSPVADWAMEQNNKRTSWYWLFRLFGYDTKGRRFLPELTTKYMREVFNPRVPNRKDIAYFSVRAAASFSDKTMSYMLWFPAHWMAEEPSPLLAEGHDGLVPVLSQTWGTVLATVRLDHLGEINHHEWRRKSLAPEALEMYGLVYDNLQKLGY